MTHAHPLTPPRGTDHLVLVASDLAGLAETYRRLGFTVGQRNRHPWGTENHIVQFNGAFLELLGVGDAGKIPERSGRSYSFGAHMRDFIAGGDGMAMLVLESRNTAVDVEAFRNARIGDFEPFFFERMGMKADGTQARVAFTIGFAEMAGAPRAGFCVCQQHEPQNFWNPAAQIHTNGVSGIASVVMVADDPSDAHEFLGAFIGQREMRATSFGIELETGRGLVEVLSREAFRFRFGQEAPVKAGQGTQFAAVTFRCASTSAVAGLLDSVHLPFGQHVGHVIVPASVAHGVVLAFSE